MGAIFLSYAREDRACAERLARVLGKAGHQVWWDRHIQSGREFAAEIESQLEKADIVLVAWSKHAGKSPWVRDEAAIGRDRGRLLPILVDGSEPPIGFRQFQALDLAGWKGRPNDRRTKALIGAIDTILSGEAPDLTHPGRRFAWLDDKRLWAMAAVLGLILAVAVSLFILRPGQAEAEPASLAVLPFKNMSAGDPYFAEGVAEEIANQLGREPQFKVAGRTSSALFKDAADFRDVGRRLHVAYVLEGSVRSAGDQVRVVVSLVDTREGTRMWSQDFRGKLDDIFAIQDRIGQQVAANVKRQLVPAIAQSTIKTSGEVYSLYVTARSLMHNREPAKLTAAIDLLTRVVRLDPNYAPGWARLALAQRLYAFYTDQDESEASRAERIRYAERAVALAPRLADAHAILGLFLSGTLDAEESRRGRQELETAVRLDPGDAEAWYWLSDLRRADLDFAGALDAYRRSARIDPFFFLVGERMPPLAWDMGHRDEATQFLKERIANHPDPFIAQIARVQLADLQNDPSSAYAYAKKAREIALPDSRPIAEARMASILLQLGLLDEAERFVPPNLINMRRGKLTFAKGPIEAFPRPSDFWTFMEDGPHLLPRLLVKLGRSRELVALYDGAFSSPENMASRYSGPGFVEMAPMLAIGLQQSGRVREGARILLLGDAMCRRTFQNNQPRIRFRVSCSRLWAVLGQKDLAINTLDRAVADGWRPEDGEYGLVTDEPVYAVLRNDPRMKRIDAILAAEIVRERRELLAAGV
jgi:TolB-like protein/Tfp pilus assembly protein PilF